MKIYDFILVGCLRCLIWRMKCTLTFPLMQSLASLPISAFGLVFAHQALASFLGEVTALPVGLLEPLVPPKGLDHRAIVSMPFQLQPRRWLLKGSWGQSSPPTSWKSNRHCHLELSGNIEAGRWWPKWHGQEKAGAYMALGSTPSEEASQRAPQAGSLSYPWLMNVVNSKSR